MVNFVCPWVITLLWSTALAARPATLWSRRAELFDGYDPDSPPPNLNGVSPLAVQVGLTINSLSYDIIAGQLHIQAWFRMEWLDTRLNYSAAEYFGPQFDPTTTYLPVETLDDIEGLLWAPDIHCTSAPSFMGAFQSSAAYIYGVESPGMRAEKPWNVLWSRPGEFSAACKLRDLSMFPFDTQKCELHFESWQFDSRFMRVFPTGQEGFQTIVSRPSSNEYRLRTYDITQQEIFYSANNANFSSMTVTLHLDRMPNYYLLNAIMPMVLMVFLSALTFWIPVNPDYSGSGERLAYSITSLLTIIAVVLFTATKRPESEETTWLDRLQASCISMVFVTVVETCFVFWLEATYSDVSTVAQLNTEYVNLQKPRAEIIDDDGYMHLIHLAEESEISASHDAIRSLMNFVKITGMTPSPRDVDIFFRLTFPPFCTSWIGYLFWKISPREEVYADKALLSGYAVFSILCIILLFVSVVQLIRKGIEMCGCCSDNDTVHLSMHNWRYSRNRSLLQRQNTEDQLAGDQGAGGWLTVGGRPGYE
eukprot:TRINITY_DN90218_c0_g1_i1.p1 TRINITY_DN90218_c0_g1~~TRINITY_DN90218_c0_g1_i1.p1  ORF type:complete len:535 (-),score=46.60 TRINITY_DN90218_c0_g1_i1:431-2035(-)